jgi:hypothetical protein
MRRSFIVIIVIITVALVSGAGYMGYQSSRPTDTPAIVAPDTVAVTTCDVEQTVTAGKPRTRRNIRGYAHRRAPDEMLVRRRSRSRAGAGQAWRS